MLILNTRVHPVCPVHFYRTNSIPEPNLETNANIFFLCCCTSAHESPVERCLLLTSSCVLVCSGPGAWLSSRSRAKKQACSRLRTWSPPRTTTHTDTSGKSHTHTHTLTHTHTHSQATLACSCFPSLTICILCVVMSYSPRRFIFTALILFYFNFSCIWCQTMVKCAQTRAHKQTHKRMCSPPPPPPPGEHMQVDEVIPPTTCSNLFNVSLRRQKNACVYTCVLYKTDWRQEQCNPGNQSCDGFGTEAQCVLDDPVNGRDLNSFLHMSVTQQAVCVCCLSSGAASNVSACKYLST